MAEIRLFLQGFRFKMGEAKTIRCIFAFVFCFLTLFVRGFRLGFATESSAPELYLWMLGDKANFVFVRLVFLLWFVPKVILSESGDIYFLMHKRTKMDIWKSNVSSVLVITLLYGALFVLMAALFYLYCRMDGVTVWDYAFVSQYFAHVFSVPGISVAGVCIALSVNAAAGLFCTGLLYYLFLLLRRRQWQATAAAVFLTVLEAAALFCGPGLLRRFLFSENLLPHVSFLYWGCAVGLLLFFTRRTAGHTAPLLDAETVAGQTCGGEDGKISRDKECHETF